MGNNLNNMPIQLAVPNSRYFIHQCYIDLARKLWYDPYSVYKKGLTSFEIYQNNRQLETITGDSIIYTIRRLIPTKHLLNQFLKQKIGNNEEIDNLVNVAKTQLNYPSFKTIPKDFIDTEKKNIVISNDTLGNKTDELEKETPNQSGKVSNERNIIQLAHLSRDEDKDNEDKDKGHEKSFLSSHQTQSIIKGGDNTSLSPEIRICTIHSDTFSDKGDNKRENMIFNQLNTLEQKKII